MFRWLRRCVGDFGASPARARKRTVLVPSISDSLERRQVLSTAAAPFVTIPAPLTPIAAPTAITTSATTVTTATPTAAVAASSPYRALAYPQATAADVVAVPAPLVGTTAATTPTVVYGQPVVQAPVTVRASAVAPPYYAGQPVVPVSSAGISAVDLNTDYVQSLYHDVLNRTGSPGEVATWVAKLNAGSSFQGVAEGFINSDEHRWAEVDAFYQEFLHRAPDRLAAAWTNQLLSGASEETVAESILNSSEYQGAHADPTQFVQGLYEDVLGRQAQAGEVAIWRANLTSGMSRREVVADFVNSTEAVDQVIEGYTAQFLHRQSDSTTASPLAEMLKPGGSASAVAIRILSSPEYVQNSTRA